jgi:hypothetical protein
VITQFIYTSSALLDLTSERGRLHVADIIACAERNNPRFGITGFLLVGRDWFAQVLEGDASAVSALFRCLLNDPRHSHVRLVETRLTRARSFADWAMGYSQEEISDLSLDRLLEQADASNVVDTPFDRILRLAEAQARTQTPHRA